MPELFEVDSLAWLVATLVRVMATLGTTAPVGSNTDPVMVAFSCAQVTGARRTTRQNAAANRKRERLMCDLLKWNICCKEIPAARQVNNQASRSRTPWETFS